MIFDTIIIGKGPAGIQAALYVKRANFNVLVIGKDSGALGKAQKIENFYGQSGAINGRELANKGIAQIENLGVTVLSDEVVGIEFCDNETNINKGKLCFKIKTLKNEYVCKTVIIATGANRKNPNINGIKEYEGHGVSYCAVCDGFFYKNKEVVVIGSGDYAVSEVNALLPLAKHITILTNGSDEVLFRNENVTCNTKKISEIVGSKNVEAVLFKDNSRVDTSGVFVAEGVATSLDFAKRLGAEVDEGKMCVNDKTMETTVPGVFAAGDCTGEIYQIPKAVYEGMKAGLGVVKYLREQ